MPVIKGDDGRLLLFLLDGETEPADALIDAASAALAAVEKLGILGGEPDIHASAVEIGGRIGDAIGDGVGVGIGDVLYGDTPEMQSTLMRDEFGNT